MKLDEKWGFINPAGQMVIAPRFESALWFFEGCARVKLDGQWGYINAQGVVIAMPVSLPDGAPGLVNDAGDVLYRANPPTP